MADWGSYLSGAGSLLGSFLGSQDQQESNDLYAENANKDRAQREKVINAGRTNSVGDTFGKFNAGTGNFEDVLSPGTQSINKGIQGAGAGAAKDLPKLFSDLATSGGAPGMSLDNARNAVNSDNDRLFNSMVNPALRDAAVIGQRTQGGSSNQSNIVNRAMERLLPQIDYGKEKDVQDLFGGTRDAYLNNYLKPLEGVAMSSKAALDPSTSTADLMQMLQGIGSTATPQNAPSPNVGNALATLGSTISANAADEKATANQNRLWSYLDASLGNKANGPTPQMPTYDEALTGY
jgi:hypothetical protein